MERRCGIALGEKPESVLWARPLYEDAQSCDLLRVVSYGGGPPVLEKRHFWMDSRGVWQPGKCRGLNGLDLAVALSCMEQYQEALMRPWKPGQGLLRRAGEENAAPPGG